MIRQTAQQNTVQQKTTQQNTAQQKTTQQKAAHQAATHPGATHPGAAREKAARPTSAHQATADRTPAAPAARRASTDTAVHTGAPGPDPYDRTALRTALAAATDDRIIYDLDGIGRQYAALRAELPGVAVRFAMKACPVDEVLGHLAALGSGFDAAGPQEIVQALRTGVSPELIHYGNTVKSDRNIAEAYRLGVRDFATDSLEDVTAIAEHAPGSRVFCRLATTGEGALWGLSHKFGCSPEDAVRVLGEARTAGLVPSGLSVHVGSQQMTAEAWAEAIDSLAAVLEALDRRGITPDRINLGGGLPALGVLDRRGRPLDPPLDKMFAVIREGMDRLRAANAGPLEFLLEPGRHLVADHGAIRAHVARLTSRHRLDGGREDWLYLSCGKFNGLYEMDQLQYQLEFPTDPGGRFVNAVVAGPTCDSDDAYAQEGGLVRVPHAIGSGDPVWIHSCGAYATAYATRGFNGFAPLPYTCIGGTGDGRRTGTDTGTGTDTDTDTGTGTDAATAQEAGTETGTRTGPGTGPHTDSRPEGGTA